MTSPDDVVGIDLSLTATGVAAGDGTLHAVTSKPPTQDTLAGRAARLDGIIDDILTTWPISAGALVVIEAPSLGQGARSGQVHERGGLWWSFVCWCFRCDITVTAIPPATLKKFATGSGVAQKADMRMALYKRAGLDIADDNQVDAWWLREAGLHLTGQPTLNLPKTHVDAIAKHALVAA